MRAFEDLERAGLVRGYPTFVGVQAEGCAPLVRAFESGKPNYERLSEVRTIAHAISNPAPPAGNAVLKLIRDHEGILMSVSDGDMVAAQRALAASEGLFCQPESAVTLAGLLKLREKRIMRADGSSVLILTGSGLKTLQALDLLPSNVREIELDDLEQGLEGPA
jgi:threonine synthase